MRLLALTLAAGCSVAEPTTQGLPDAAHGPAASPASACPPYDPATPHRMPPPLTGGTLFASGDGRTAVVSDPDRDRISLVDLQVGRSRNDVSLQIGDEPNHATEDRSGRAYVILRGGGAVVTIDQAAGVLLDRRPVCPAPRGIAYDPPRDVLYVACAGGELVTLPAADGPPTRTLHLDRDLRDVIVRGDHLLVSRFRSAELLTVDIATGAVRARARPSSFSSSLVRDGAHFEPAVAWRTLILNDTTELMIHQRGQLDPIALHPLPPPPDLGTPDPPASPYGGGGASEANPCASAIVHTTLSLFTAGQPIRPSPAIPRAVLPIDGAILGDQILLVAAASSDKAPQLLTFSLATFTGDCVEGGAPSLPPGTGQPIAVAASRDGFIVQTRDPANLILADGSTIVIGNEPRGDRGHDLFHRNSGAGLACASCHPEGGDDGRVWRFDFGPRRTQSLRGGVAGTAPFHWSGDMPDLRSLVDEVFTHRMGGPPLSCAEKDSLARFLETIPLLPGSAPADPVAVERGRALFYDDTVAGGACAVCHSGEKLTNNATASVGTGEPFQVPSLRGVGFRGPFLHDGCAPTLADRFGPCGGGAAHGNASRLSAPQIADLIAFLETL